MSGTLDLFTLNPLEDAEASTTKADGALDAEGSEHALVSEYVVALPTAEVASRGRVVSVQVARWVATTEVESQTTITRRYAGRGIWLPPPAVASPVAGDFEDAVIADPIALAAMDQAEQRLSEARDAEFDREREERLYYRD